jgi:hypothetical protein
MNGWAKTGEPPLHRLNPLLPLLVHLHGNTVFSLVFNASLDLYFADGGKKRIQKRMVLK